MDINSIWVFSMALLSIFVVSTHAHSKEELLTRTIEALEKTESFFAEDYSAINVDGLYGIRVGQGSINQTLTDCSNRRFNCPESLKERLMALIKRIDDTAAKAMPYIEADDSKYYEEFFFTFSAPFIVRYRIELLAASVKEPGHNEVYSEKRGDACLTKLFGTYIDENEEESRTPKCTITDDCWDYMTREDQCKYSVTHQLLYFILGETIGCLEHLEARLKKTDQTVLSLREFERKLCGHIFAETLDEAKTGSVASIDQDIFLEQGLMCGILGFADFYDQQRLQMVLSWQSPGGCFGLTDPQIRKKFHLDQELTKNQGRLLSRMKEEARNIYESRSKGRQLLREKYMAGGCLAHKTGLSFGYLGGYVRYFVNTMYGPSKFERRMLRPSVH